MRTLDIQKNDGYMLLNVLIIATIASIILIGITTWYTAVYGGSRYIIERERAFQVAESGIDYYRWHLAHWPTDYKDGQSTAGPYEHDVTDGDGNVIGKFSLNITPPSNGSTIVTVESVGTLTDFPNIKRTLRTQLAIPSLAKFSVINDDSVRFGEETEVFGPLHSNNGIRFDGLAHNIVSSALVTYDDEDHTGSQEHAVHTHVNPPPSSGSNEAFRPAEAPPNALASRPDIFVSGREVGVPAFDFDGITSTMASLKSLSLLPAGHYIGPSGTGRYGYRLLLKTNDTFSVYRVNSLTSNSCSNTLSQDDWGKWTISSQTLLGTYDFPENGVIFVEDHVWVEGAINTARLTIAAARFPESESTYRSIIINNDLKYTNTDGQDTIALISQNNIIAGYGSEDDLEIDAALIAQKGFVGRYYYSSSCGSSYKRDNLTLFGMIASKKRYGFAYTDNTGYLNRTIIYDANLLYSPPPFFPLAGDQYETISWEEIE